MDFSQTENEYQRLKAQVDSGQLTEADFRAQLQDLMVEDEQGRWWMLGYETGRWHVHDGEKWAPADPFASVPAPVTEPPTSKADLSNATATQFPHAQPAASVAPVAAATSVTRRALTLWALALIMVAWAACSWFLFYLYDNVGIYGSTIIVAAGAWLLAGLAAGVAVRLVEPAVRWRSIVLGALVWGVCGLLIHTVVLDTVPVVIPYTLVGLVGGLAMGLMVKQALTSMRWYHVLIIAAAWAAAFFIEFELTQLAINEVPYSLYPGVYAVGGALRGVIGGGVTLWQIRRAQKAAARQP